MTSPSFRVIGCILRAALVHGVNDVHRRIRYKLIAKAAAGKWTFNTESTCSRKSLLERKAIFILFNIW